MIKTILPKAWDIPEIFKQRMGQDVGRQRLMSEEGHHLAVMHELPVEGDRGIRKPALFWIKDTGEWKSMPSSGGWSALKQHVQDYQNRVTELDTMLERIEGFETAEEVHKILDLATPLHRATRNMAAVIQNLRKALPDSREVLELRDMAVATELVAELLVTDTKSSSDYLIAKNASIQAKESKKAAKEAQKLNRLAALFFPLVTLASFFGMNPPGEVFMNGGLMILIVGLTIGVILRSLISRAE